MGKKVKRLKKFLAKLAVKNNADYLYIRERFPSGRPHVLYNVFELYPKKGVDESVFTDAATLLLEIKKYGKVPLLRLVTRAQHKRLGGWPYGYMKG